MGNRLPQQLITKNDLPQSDLRLYMKKSSKEDFKQTDLFASLLSELDTEDTPLFSKNYQEQQDMIDKERA